MINLKTLRFTLLFVGCGLIVGCQTVTDNTTITNDRGSANLALPNQNVNQTLVNTDTDQPDALCNQAAVSPRLPAGDVLALAKTEEPASDRFVNEHDAELVPVDDNKSFAVWWQPDDFDPATDTVIVSLHGHGAWATKDFEVWYPELAERGYAYLGLQWWFGRSLESNGYYDPDQIYRLISEQLADHAITPGQVVFQGFSMGSARAYAITLRDHLCGQDYFGVTIANAGPWEDDYDSNVDVIAGDYGDSPYAGTHWILFCGDQDENENSQTQFTHVCDGMEHTQTMLERYGGSIDLFLQDPTGDHGSMMINRTNVQTILDQASERIQS